MSDVMVATIAAVAVLSLAAGFVGAYLWSRWWIRRVEPPFGLFRTRAPRFRFGDLSTAALILVVAYTSFQVAKASGVDALLPDAQAWSVFLAALGIALPAVFFAGTLWGRVGELRDSALRMHALSDTNRHRIEELKARADAGTATREMVREEVANTWEKVRRGQGAHEKEVPGAEVQDSGAPEGGSDGE